MIRSTLFRRRRPSCPMCESLGFKKVEKDFWGDPVLRCNSCSHEWVSRHGKPDARATDRRSS